jgi:AcrR family transcriptional regulator
VEAFRGRLCDIAEHQFAERGPDAVTIRQLAAEMGVSAMTPYRYFADKDAILAAVRARAFDRHAQALEDARAANPDPVARANAIGAAYVCFALDNPEAYKLMFDIRQPNAGDYPDLVRAAERSKATMTAHLRDLAAAGLFHGDAEKVGHLYWAALHGPIMLQLSGMLDAPLDAPTLIAGLTRALDRAHFARAAPR